ncbi:MAG: type II toxin-antitoxin system VapC family toxin [Thermodesulfobacteriota bacterium]|nr:type II toxin-antitoxin system VapC family toxin [Thermodesulfobacteriota bacterium]
MKRCTLDTNIITAFLKNDSRVVERVSDYLEFFDKLTINIISYYEILRGLKDLGNEEKLCRFDSFIQENELVFITKDTIKKAAEIYAYLKKEGNLIEDADILMASTAIAEDLVLITNNIKHFKRVKDLEIENWLES